MKKYFNNINVKPNGGHTWFQVWLGHDESAENLLMNMKHWSSQSDTYIYKKMNEYELEISIKEELKSIPEKFNYLFVGHWLKGDVGQDRKNVGLLIKIFYALFNCLLTINYRL